jgi:hypothetical protein
MNPETIAALTYATMTLFCGTFMTLKGFRLIGTPRGQDFKVDQWHERYGTLMKIAGPPGIAYGLYLVAVATIWK